MEFFYIVGFFAFIGLIFKHLEKRKVASEARAVEKARALCGTCAYAHIACDVSERNVVIACTFGGTVRHFDFAVSACTLYCNRAAACAEIVRVAGFAREAATTDALIAAQAKQ